MTLAVEIATVITVIICWLRVRESWVYARGDVAPQETLGIVSVVSAEG